MFSGRQNKACPPNHCDTLPPTIKSPFVLQALVGQQVVGFACLSLNIELSTIGPNKVGSPQTVPFHWRPLDPWCRAVDLVQAQEGCDILLFWQNVAV